MTVQSKLTGSQLVAHPSETPDWFVQVTATTSLAALVDSTVLLQPPATG